MRDSGADSQRVDALACLLARIDLHAQGRGNDWPRHLGLSPLEFRILARTGLRGSAGPTQLAREFGISPSTASVAVQNLERAKLVRRERDPSDLRRMILAVTPATLFAFAQAEAGMRNVADLLLQALPPVAQQTLIDLLDLASRQL